MTNMAKRRYTKFFEAFFGIDLSYEDAKFIYIKIRQNIRERGMTLDDVLLEISLDENFSDEDRLAAEQLLAEGAPLDPCGDLQFRC